MSYLAGFDCFYQLQTEDGRAVVLPMQTETFRGESVVVTEGRPPHKPEAQGFICLDGQQDVYAGVCRLKWVATSPAIAAKNLLAEPEPLQAWLAQFDEGKVVGKTLSMCMCPIAAFLQVQLRGQIYAGSNGKLDVFIWGEIHQIEVPGWVRKFIDGIDAIGGFNEVQITAGQAIAILDEIKRESANAAAN